MQDISSFYVLICSPAQQSINFCKSTTLNQYIYSSNHWSLSTGEGSCVSKALDILIYMEQHFLPQFFYVCTCTTPPFQLIQKLRNSSQERRPGVEALTSGSPILPKEIQERVFCLPPSTISSISALSWGLAERAKWALLWVFTATWNWFILAGFFTYWYSYLLGVEMWILSENGHIKYTQALSEFYSIDTVHKSI